MRGRDLAVPLSAVQVTREFQLDESQSFSVYRSPGYRDELSQKELGLTLQAIPIKLVVHVICPVCHVIIFGLKQAWGHVVSI